MPYYEHATPYAAPDLPLLSFEHAQLPGDINVDFVIVWHPLAYTPHIREWP